MEPPALEVIGLAKCFGATRALADASFAVGLGTVHGLVGENGAGKSTLIKCLAGLHRPDAGTVRLGGTAVRLDGPQAAAAQGLSFVHQELSLVPFFDAAENAFLGRPHPTRLGLVDRPAMRRALAAALADIAPDLRLDRPVKHLTIGERQIVEIGRALLGSPRLIVMDEPTAALGAEETARLHAIVHRLAASGAAVLYISHRLADVLALCSRITVLRDGATVFDGATASLDHDRLVALMSGGGAVSVPVGAAISANKGRPAALAIEALRLRPGRDPVELALAPGEIVGLYGLVGAGRSRLLKSIWGARRASSGRVSVAGRPLPPHSIRAALAAGLAYVPEDRRTEGLVPGLPVARNLSLPHLRTFRAWPWLPWPSPDREVGFAADVGRRLAIRFATPRQRVGALSGGNQQKVLVGRWLRYAPTVLLLDEPTRGIDVRTKADLHAALRQFAAQGVAILFATSDLEELLALSDRIGLLQDGAWAGTLEGEERTAQAVLSRLFGITQDAAA